WSLRAVSGCVAREVIEGMRRAMGRGCSEVGRGTARTAGVALAAARDGWFGWARPEGNARRGNRRREALAGRGRDPRAGLSRRRRLAPFPAGRREKGVGREPRPEGTLGAIGGGASAGRAGVLP